MKKNLSRLLMLLALPIALGLASCAEKDNPAVAEVIDQTEEMPDKTEPTEDQLSTLVTANLPAAVLGQFDEGSTGAALVKRLPQLTAGITPETRLVVLPGSDFSMEGATPSYDLKEVVRVYLNGGYIALVQPTQEQIGMFDYLFLVCVIGLEQEAYKQMFDISEAAAARAAQHSQAAERLKARTRNLQAAATRADGDDFDPNAPFAEMVIFGPTGYFMQEPLTEEHVTYVYSGDDEGNTTEPEAVTTRQERTPAISGTLADAAAQWLNETEQESAAQARAITRASGSTAINELMDASETFTYSGAINWTNKNNVSQHYINRVIMKVSSWGVHNMESNKDYYYLKQNVTLSMGNQNGWKIYYPTRAEDYWYSASGFGDYDNWFGAFLSKYETSMNLSGSGSIHLEAAVPNTDNNSSSTSITTGSSSSTTITNGISWGFSVGANASGPMGSFSFGGSSSCGTTTGTSFSMGMSQTVKELGVKKNTQGTKATWTYTGSLPQFYVKDTNAYYYCHQTPAAILVNDCDVANEICWSVDNPSGQYKVDITSTPETAALLYSYILGSAGNRPHKYVYNSSGGESYNHTLLEPNRAMQTWRMNLTIDEWEGSPVVGALGELESTIRNGFPDIYANVFTIADKKATDLNTITAIVNYSKQIWANRLDMLQSYAKSYGIRKFTIHWSCDDLNVKTREGFTVKEPCTFTATDGTGSGYDDLFDGNASTIWITNKKKDGVYYVEFKGSRVITPTAYILTTGAYTSSYPAIRPKDWKMKAKLNEADEWTTIATVTDDTRLPNQSGQTARYDLDVTGRKWQYFRFEVSATQGDPWLYLGAIDFDY